MPRKSTSPTKEPASLPEVLIPPSQANAAEREAYWLNLLAEPENLKNAVQTEDFWPMIQNFPEALWTGGRLSMYLYRREDDSGVSIRNAEGKKKYIKIFHGPIDEEFVTRNYGGGKFTIYLKLDNKLTLTEYTFYTDGVPKAQPGQVVELSGKEVSLSGAPATPPESGDAVSKVIDASAKANESAMGILAHASETAIDMVKAQAVTAATPPKDNTLETIRTVVEILKPQAPAGNSMKDALEIVDRLDAMAARRNPAPVEPPETPIEKTLDAVEKLTGGISLSELLDKRRPAAATDSTPSWVSVALGAAGKLIEVIPSVMAERTKQLALEVQLRQMGVAPPPANQPRLPANVPTAPATVIPITTQPANGAQTQPILDKNQVVRIIVTRLCAGFDRHRDTGGDVAVAINVDLGEQIEAMGLEKALTDTGEMTGNLIQMPDLAGMLGQRSQDARWKPYESDFLAEMQDRWAMPESDEERGEVSTKKEPQPAA
jgi:hypothetical protein